MYDEVELTWGKEHSFFFMDGNDESGETLALCLDEINGSGFASKDAYLYGRIDIDIKLVDGNSAGTVSTFYIIPDDVPWEQRDEIDFEFLGNVTGQPYTLHTNIFVNGVDHRVQQFKLWFDPSADYHTYSIEWNPKHIIFLVDGVPIRDYKNAAAQGKPFPSWQHMRVHGTLWNADDWATRGGRDKTDWKQAPFYAYYRNLRVQPCVPSPGVSWCGAEPPESTWFDQGAAEMAAAVQSAREHLIYDYCRDPTVEDTFKEECSF
ncbi:hypothetical protein QOZ80_8AG0622800 [Eleusine coracana subsp. coracana]|nr:hypothetical protein QOZ80_8AG0622800 [Eleusine coracana subsp. coracana]